MKFFSRNKKDKEPQIKLTEDDKQWVEESFDWLIKIYGYPNRAVKQIILNETFFPETLKQKKSDVGAILHDLANLLSIDKTKISFVLEEDIRNSGDIPFQIQGNPFHCQTEILKSDGKNIYKIFIAKYLLDYPERLLYNLIYELIKVRFLENNIVFDTGEDTDLFIYLAGIYFGFGLILSRNLIDTGQQVYGFWETKWNYTSEMPVPVMAYSLALFHSLFEDDGTDWRDLLPPTFKTEFLKAQDVLKKNPHKLYNKRELDSADLYGVSAQKSNNHDFEEAIACLQKILFLTQDANLKAIVYNNIGYNYLLLDEYEKSITYFQKALEIDQNFGFAYDNLGFALIMTGDIESGKYYLGLAMKCENNDNGYSYRNLALYYQQKKEMKLAEEYFQKAFNSIVIPVDLLEYFYAKFLFETGDSETAMKYLKIAVDKKNPQAVDLIKEITNNGLRN